VDLDGEDGDPDGTGTYSPEAKQNTRRITVVDSNIAGGTTDSLGALKQLNHVESAIAANNPDLVFLQEVCNNPGGQLDELKRVYAGWSLQFYPEVPAETNCTSSHTPSPKGSVVMSRFTSRASATYDLPEDTSLNNYGVACLTVNIPGSASGVLACSLKFRATSPGDPDGSNAHRVIQSNALHNLFAAPVQNDTMPVIIGGDFNSRSGYTAMDKLYRLSTAGNFNGPGLFHEGDQLDATYFGARESGTTCWNGGGGGACRSAQPTHGGTKYDYVFFSRNRTDGSTTPGKNAPLHEEVISNPTSDHDIVFASAIVKLK
jgi:endonuclease/exonuclease/phosphatase family metal-dependent hydrolase